MSDAAHEAPDEHPAMRGEQPVADEPTRAEVREPALSWAELFVDRTTTDRTTTERVPPTVDDPFAASPAPLRREVPVAAATEAVPVVPHRPVDVAPTPQRRAAVTGADEEPAPAPPRRQEIGERARRTAPADAREGAAQARSRPPRDVRVVRGTRSRRLVRRIDVITVFKVSVAFYLLALLTLIIAGFVVWNVADVFGLIKSLQNSIRTLFSLKTFTLHSGSVLFWSVAIGGVLCLVGAALTTLAATIYNLLSDVVGGIEVVVVTDAEADPRR